MPTEGYALCPVVPHLSLERLYLPLASNGLGFNENGVRFYAGVILLPKNPYPLNFKFYQSLL